ncbi:SIMPL domain-containing protein [candidate division WOR-3 bacterium]|nr:SIMPL domain-containing protein [candidate division WOR-3 bacterium]
MKRVLTASLAILLFSGLAWAEDEKPERRTLVVTGTAEVVVAPDICYMSFAVESSSKKAQEAYEENVRIMNAINAAIRAHGVEGKDMRTAYFSFSPQYRYTDNGKSILEGYYVYNTLQVSVRDLSKVSAVLDTAVTAGAKDVQGINFTVENPKKYTEEARRDALKAAKKKAQEAAELLGFRLGAPISVSESEPWDYTYYAQEKQYLGGFAETGADQAPALEAGELKLTRTVYVTYEILDK